MINKGIRTYKTSIYHPSSNPAKRVLREVGRILRTYCQDDHKKWSEYISDTETFLNLSHHNTLGVCPYQMMFLKPPPRDITKIIQFPEEPDEEIDITRIYNRILHKTELRKKRQSKTGVHPIKYNVGEKVLIRNQQQPSSIEGIAKKLLLLHTGLYVINKDNGNNIYVIVYSSTNRIKGTYNETEMRKYLE